MIALVPIPFIFAGLQDASGSSTIANWIVNPALSMAGSYLVLDQPEKRMLTKVAGAIWLGGLFCALNVAIGSFVGCCNGMSQIK